MSDFISPKPVSRKNKLPVCLFVSIFLLGNFSCSVSERLHAKTTVTRMGEIMILLEEQDGPCESDCLRQLIEEHERLDLLTDSWGHPIRVTMEVHEDEPPTYRVRSLGNDGKEGDCCVRWVDNFADDAVLQGNTWLQVWHI